MPKTASVRWNSTAPSASPKKRRGSCSTGFVMPCRPAALPIWMAAIWLISNAKNGVSSMELHRSIGVTQKTAWFMLHRIRDAMQTGSFADLDGGNLVNLQCKKRRQFDGTPPLHRRHPKNGVVHAPPDS